MKSTRLEEYSDKLCLMAADLRRFRDTSPLADQLQALVDFDFEDTITLLEDREKEAVNE